MRKLVAVLVALVATTTVNAGVISTFGSWNGSSQITSFGISDTAVYGQTFKAPTDSVLNSFTFALQRISGGNTLTFAPYVMAWDGAKATGPVLFRGPLQNLPANSPFTNITVNTGGIALTPGQQYVAFFSVMNDAPTYPNLYSSQSNGNLAGFGWMSNDNTYTDGRFVFLNAFTAGNSNFGSVSTTNWDNFIAGDLAFRLDFSATPEPISLFVFGGLIVGGAGVALRRRMATKATA